MKPIVSLLHWSSNTHKIRRYFFFFLAGKFEICVLFWFWSWLLFLFNSRICFLFVCFLDWLFLCFFPFCVFLPFFLDITVMVDWALKINYLSIYPFFLSVCLSCWLASLQTGWLAVWLSVCLAVCLPGWLSVCFPSFFLFLLSVSVSVFGFLFLCILIL